MRFLFFLSFGIFLNLKLQAQSIERGNTYYYYPEWDSSYFKNAGRLGITSDSIFYFATFKKAKDSALAAIVHFNEGGMLIEKDEFSIKTKEVVKIVNYSYAGDLRMSEETVSKDNIEVNDDGGVSRGMKTFEYDSAGNLVAENEYTYIHDTISRKSITTHRWEYDEQGHKTKELVTLPTNKSYLHRLYSYENGALTEEKVYNINQQLIYTYVYETDKKTGVRNVYVINTSKKLKAENFYDSQDRLVKIKAYTDRDIHWDYATNEFVYDDKGLINNQSFLAPNGDGFGFKHFYTKR